MIFSTAVQLHYFIPLNSYRVGARLVDVASRKVIVARLKGNGKLFAIAHE
ncbi:MAG: hypothetical protein ACUVQG_08715 [Thermogutta sp.]